jgi:hypothetical protein
MSISLQPLVHTLCLIEEGLHVLLNRRLNRLRVRAYNLIHLVTVLEQYERWHGADAQFLG